MKNGNIPPWLLILGFIILANLAPQLIGFVLFFAILYFVIQVFSKQNGSRFQDFRDLFNQEFGDTFSTSKKKDEKVITLDNKRKKPDFSFSTPMMPQFPTGKAIAGIGVALILVFLIIDGFVDVKPGNAAVIFDRGRGVLQKPLTEGLHLKVPFWQEATKFQTKKQEFTMAGEYTGIDDVDAVRGRSKDGQDVFVDVTVTYQISAEDTPFLRSQFINEAGYKSNIVFPAARSVVYDAIGKFNALELISDKRDDFTDFIALSLQEVFGGNRIQFREVFIRKITFSPEFAKAIEEKQIAEQRIKTAQNRKLEAEELKQKTIIEAEAEAESIRLKGESLRQSPEVIQLQFVEKMAPGISWGILPDGALPLINLEKLQQQ